MKKRFAALIAALVYGVFTLSSCAEKTEVSTTPQSRVTNGNFKGIAFDTSARTVWSADPVPSGTGVDIPEISKTADASESGDTPPDTSETEAAASSETTAATTTTTAAATAATTTTTAATTTTTTAAATTTATTTTAAATTTTTTTTTTTAATTAATAAPPAFSSGSYPKNSYKALNYSEMKGVWISYIELSYYMNGKNEEQFRSAAGSLFDNCVSLGLNTVYVHARAFGDAFYFSELFPFTKHISGAIGKRTAYDPLKILVEEAHKRKLSFHAWINPLRLCSEADMANVPAECQIKKWYSDASLKGKYIVNVGGTWYLNPAYDDVVKLIGSGVREIVSGYDVDGVQIDDYFYPTTDASFDSAAFANSGYYSLPAFRIKNCNSFVREIYNAVHGCSGSAIFGASPQGNMYNNINNLYADPGAWSKGGYVDYLAPQIYYGFDNAAQPFKRCNDEWNELVAGTGVKLCTGLAVYKVGQEDKWAGSGKNEWQNTTTMLKRQVEYAKSCKNYGGFALYSYNYLFTSGYNTAEIQKEKENLKPLIYSDPL